VNPRPRIVVIDNYDSFTYNLVQYLETLGATCEVFLNDQTTADAVRESAPAGILISPGPGTPADAGVSLSVLGACAGVIPIFGVCLGHQCMGELYGGEIVRADRLMHGKTSNILHDAKGVFGGLPSPFEATRYHSLVIAPESLPGCLEVSAKTNEGEIMGVRHRELAIEGVQFHPESILTQHGMQIMDNWMRAL
jgi:para-aminobenzoate synthetase component II